MYLITIYITSNVMIRNHDGSALYYIVAKKGNQVIKEQGYKISFDVTTRNRSYLEALAEALQRMRIPQYALEIICDNHQVVTDAAHLEERRALNFRKAGGGEYANADMWLKLSDLLDNKKCSWKYMDTTGIEKDCEHIVL